MWKHVIIDDFLTKEHFDYINKTFDTVPPMQSRMIKSFSGKFIEFKGEIAAHTYVVTDKKVSQKTRFKANIKTNKFDEKIIKDIYNQYNPKLLELLKELAPEKVKDYNHSILIFTATDKNYKYPIHTDTPDKLLSVVIYLRPEKNVGTILYEDKKGKNPVELEWKQNRALIFSRAENTWHSYQGDGINDRYVLVYNLMSKPTR